MPHKKKKFPKGTKINAADFFGMHHEPAVESDSSSDNEREEARHWQSERERQKAASAAAEKLTQKTKQQHAVIFGEEHDVRAYILNSAAIDRSNLEETFYDKKIQQEWKEYQTALQQEEKRREIEKKAALSQFGTQQMLHRADIAEKETKERISFFNSFIRGKADITESKTKHTPNQLESDRKKAAERAKAYEARMRQSHAESSAKKPGLFNPEPAPLAATAPVAKTSPAKETEKKGGWWPW